MKVIIAGSQAINSMEVVEAAIAASGFTITEVVCGKARGVDTCGEEWAKAHGIPVTPFEANWYPDGPGGRLDRSAGLQRNTQMGLYAEALIAIWTGVSPGTAHMINFMRRCGKPVFVHLVLGDL